MSFASYDDLISKLTNSGKFFRYDYYKMHGTGIASAAATAGRWYDSSGTNGLPTRNNFAGTSVTWTTCDETTGNGTQIFGIPHGGNVSPDTKHVLNVAAVGEVATNVPGFLQLVDLQGYWPGISLNSTTVNLSGTPTLRYANGEGCRLYAVCTTASGATNQTLTASYTNQAGTSGRSLGFSTLLNGSGIVSQILNSGTAAANYGPFLPLAAGDTGVQNVASVTFSATNATGAMALCLARPLLTIPITTLNVAAEKDFVNYFPSFPQILDGACLVWIYFAGAAVAANAPMRGYIDFAWG